MADLKISELPLRTRAPGEASSADPGPGAPSKSARRAALPRRAPGEASSALPRERRPRSARRAARPTSSAWRASSADPAAGSAVQVATV